MHQHIMLSTVHAFKRDVTVHVGENRVQYNELPAVQGASQRARMSRISTILQEGEHNQAAEHTPPCDSYSLQA